MKRHLRKWITIEALNESGGRIEAEIVDVKEELIRNKFDYSRSLQPVVYLSNGYRWIPNQGDRVHLIEMLGTSETDRWKGRRIDIGVREVKRADSEPAERRRYEKFVMLSRLDAVQPFPTRNRAAG